MFWICLDSPSDRMLQNRSLVKQTTNYMCEYSVLAPKEIPPIEEDSALNRALRVTGRDSIFSECGCYWQKYSETGKQLPASAITGQQQSHSTHC